MEKSKTLIKASWKMMLVMMMAVVCMIIASQKADAASGVQVNATNFPDAGLRSQVSSVVDKNRDGALSTAEINAVTKFDASGTWNQIKNLKGLERFTKLANLTMRVNLSNVDLSRITSLKTLNLCNSAFSGNMTIKVKYLDKLDAEYMQNVKGITIDGDVRKADISRNPKLENITTKNTVSLSLLEAAYCTNDVSGDNVTGPNNMNVNIIGKGVKKLDISRGAYKTVKVKGTIENLYSDYMNRLESVNVEGANIKQIFVDRNPKMKKVSADYGTMTDLKINAEHSKIESIEASYCRNLNSLKVYAKYTPLKTVEAMYCNKASNYTGQVGTMGTVYVESPALKNVYLSYSTAKNINETIKGSGSTIVDQQYNRFTESVNLAGSEKVKTFNARYGHKNVKAYNLPQGASFLK